MYIPKAYQMLDKELIFDFIEQNSFGILISHSDTTTATHLPFLVKKNENETYLYGHMARANPQWKEIQDEVLVIFSGPQRYISPSWYAESEVPTWDYVAAHVYGQFELINKDEDVLGILEKTVDFYESSYEKPWNLAQVSKEYVDQLAKHIVGFKINISKIEAAWKLHQDYSLETQKGVVNFLEKCEDDNSKIIASMIKKNLK